VKPAYSIFQFSNNIFWASGAPSSAVHDVVGAEDAAVGAAAASDDASVGFTDFTSDRILFYSSKKTLQRQQVPRGKRQAVKVSVKGASFVKDNLVAAPKAYALDQFEVSLSCPLLQLVSQFQRGEFRFTQNHKIHVWLIEAFFRTRGRMQTHQSSFDLRIYSFDDVGGFEGGFPPP
jgi:hypothetical protein